MELEGNPFDKNTVIVSTADRGIDKRVRAAAISSRILVLHHEHIRDPISNPQDGT